jgi:hypothetical protein
MSVVGKSASPGTREGRNLLGLAYDEDLWRY